MCEGTMTERLVRLKLPRDLAEELIRRATAAGVSVDELIVSLCEPVS